MSLIFGSAPIHCFFLGLFSFDSGRRVKVTDFIVGQENILSCIQSLAWRLLHSNRILLGFSHIACSSLHNWYWETRVYSTAAKKSVTKVPGFNNQLITFKRYLLQRFSITQLLKSNFTYSSILNVSSFLQINLQNRLHYF